MRIVSLVPSATEIVYALGLEPVATSHACDYPPTAKTMPNANQSRIDDDGTSRAINEQVASAEHQGGVYALDHAVLRQAKPDLIITQGVCEVCAVDHTLVEAAVKQLDLDTDVLTTHPHSLQGILDDIACIGAATGQTDAATDLIGSLERRIDAIDRATPDGETRVTVLDWLDPIMVAGHWVPELVELAGGRYDLADHESRSRPREWQSILDYDPEILIAAPCGFPLDQTIANLHEVTNRPGFARLTAAQTGQVHAMDGHNFINRPGPRIVDSLEYLAGLIAPAHVDAPPSNVTQPIADAHPT